MITTKSLSYGERTFQICGDLSDGYFDKIEGHVHSNTFLIPLLANHVSSDSTIIDVGANIGLTTVLAHELVPNCRTVSIEPSTAIQGLRQTIAANAITRNVIIDCCVGDSDGEIGFGTVADNTSASHVSESAPKKKMLMIDTIVREQRLDRVDFIKIDVEGFESKVLDGMKETNKLFGPLVFMEFNAFTLTAYGNISPRALLNRIIAEYGFFIVQNDSALQKIDTPDQALGFLHRNMIEHGCVDDIAFTMSPERRRAFSLQ